MTKDSEPIVSIPLNEYLGLVSGQLDRPLPRSRAERASKRLYRTISEAQEKLPVWFNSEQRGKPKTLSMCNGLNTRITDAVFKSGEWLKGNRYALSVFRECLDHYKYFYDEQERERMIEKQKRLDERMGETGMDFSRLNLPHLPTEDQPILADYQSQLHLELKPLLPLYVATYFVPRIQIEIPFEIEKAIS